MTTLDFYAERITSAQLALLMIDEHAQMRLDAECCHIKLPPIFFKRDERAICFWAGLTRGERQGAVTWRHRK